VQFEALEITQQDVPRQVCILEPGEVVQRLLFRLDEVPAGALLFDQKETAPEQIDEAPLPAGFF